MVYYSLDTAPRNTIIVAMALVSLGITFLPTLISPDFTAKFGPLSTFGVFGLLFLLFDKFLWRYTPGVGIPNLSGIWRGTIERGIDPGTTRGKTSQIVIRITQTWTRIDVVFQGTHSVSRSELVGMSLVNPQHIELYYSYQKQPKTLTPSGQKHSTGYTRLVFEEDGAQKRLVGPYFSDEYRGGSICVTREPPAPNQTTSG